MGRGLASALWIACVGCGDGATPVTEGGGGAAAFGAQDPHAAVIENGTCTPHGQRFEEVYACDTVQGPSATEPPGASAAVAHDPATLADPDYGWALAEIEACSCTCCHAEGGTGTYVWSASFAPAWSDSADATPLSNLGTFGANHAPSLPPEENNGFSRESTGHPSTDPARFGAFIDRELARRGL